MIPLSPNGANRRGSLQEFTRITKVVLHTNYLATVADRTTDFVEISVDNKKIKIFGVSKEAMQKNLQESLKDLVYPVVKIEDLLRTCHALLQKEFLQALKKDFPESPREIDYHKYRSFSSKEREEFRQSMALVPALPGVVRSILQDIQSEKVRTIFLLIIGPQVEQKEIRRALVKQRVRSLLKERKNPFAMLEKLKLLPRKDQAVFSKVFPLLEGQANLLEVAKESPSEYCLVDTAMFALEKSLHKEVLDQVEYKWLLPKEKIAEFKRLIDLCSLEISENYFLEGENELQEILIGKKESIKQQFVNVLENQDVYFDDRRLAQVIEVTKLPLMPLPRVEKIKVALRDYFAKMEEIKRFANEVDAQMKAARNSLYSLSSSLNLSIYFHENGLWFCFVSPRTVFVMNGDFEEGSGFEEMAAGKELYFVALDEKAFKNQHCIQFMEMMQKQNISLFQATGGAISFTKLFYQNGADNRVGQ